MLKETYHLAKCTKYQKCLRQCSLVLKGLNDKIYDNGIFFTLTFDIGGPPHQGPQR